VMVGKCRFHAQRECGGWWLCSQLPSGRNLRYRNAQARDCIVPWGASEQVVNATPHGYSKKLYGGLLCVGADTQVITDSGLKPIIAVRNTDKVWDGVEWVSTDGNVCNGVTSAGTWLGVRITPDHVVFNGEEGRTALATSQKFTVNALLNAWLDLPPEHRKNITRPKDGRYSWADVKTGPVYDLVNCGPRNRFAIMTEFGPAIIHNCENIDQAISRDIMVHHMVKFPDVVLTIHDEILREVPLRDATADLHHTEQVMRTSPQWAETLPLGVEAFLCPYYTKIPPRPTK